MDCRLEIEEDEDDESILTSGISLMSPSRGFPGVHPGPLMSVHSLLSRPGIFHTVCRRYL